jgi:predicted DNA-binding protein
MAEKLKKLAKKDDRPLSGYIRRVLALHIEAEENNG